MERVAVTNTTASPIYVGADMIPAGETRHFYRDQVPEHLLPVETPAEAVIAPATDDPMAELQAKSIREITELLPALSADEIKTLRDLEAAGSGGGRVTLLAKLDEVLLERAATNTTNTTNDGAGNAGSNEAGDASSDATGAGA